MYVPSLMPRYPREERESQAMNLRRERDQGMNLRGMKLRGMILRGMNLRGMNLRAMNLKANHFSWGCRKREKETW